MKNLIIKDAINPSDTLKVTTDLGGVKFEIKEDIREKSQTIHVHIDDLPKLKILIDNKLNNI